MKIAMMTNNYKPFIAGVPISIERLVKALQSQGHKAMVFAPEYREQENEPDVIRYRALVKNVAGGFSVPNSLDFSIEKNFKEEEFDLIHMHHPMMIGSMAKHLSGKYGVPLVFTYHTRFEQYLHYVGLSFLKGMMPSYLKYCTKKCDLIIAPTNRMKQYLLEAGIKTPIRVLPTGILKDNFLPDQEKASAIREKLLGNKKRLFVTVSRLAKEKNLDFLIRSMKQLKDGGADFKLALIGDGPFRGHLEKLVRGLYLQEEIIFAGTVENQEIKNYCHAADLFLFASKSETQGIVLIEAMAAGTPVLAVEATGTEEVVENGVNGYMTEASETIFTGKLMDILEKRELEVLRTGAVRTAQEYRSEEIGRRAAAFYAEAVEIRKEKQLQKRMEQERRQPHNALQNC